MTTIKNVKSAILVTGSKGQVGQELQFLAKKYPRFRFLFVDVDELDITNGDAVRAFFEKNPVSYCINCAAYTAVDKAESEEELATKINLDAVWDLAAGCKKSGGLLLQLSTDYVYHNSQNVPMKEGDLTDPKGVYALSKLAGDHIALSQGGIVIRTSWVYSTFGNNFVKTMLRLGSERSSLTVLFDQIGTPTYARDLARAMLDMVQKIENQEVDRKTVLGVWHYSNEGVTSWYDFAKAIFEIKKMKVKVNPIETKDYPTAAKRPPFSVLNKGKIKATFGLEIPHWRESLQACLKELH